VIEGDERAAMNTDMILATTAPPAARPDTGEMTMRHVLCSLLLAFSIALPAAAQTPITYRVTFPEPEHHWLQVDMTVAGLGSQPLHARMSRSSPGRYAVHEFAKNIFWIEAYDGSGKRLAYTRPDVDAWEVGGHDGTVRLVYRIFGDTPDGTYMGVDTTHAHMNMPATFLWSRGMDDRPIRITFEPPAGSGWTVGTQLYPTADAFTFTAPNLQYFLDSPTELAPFLTGSFTLPYADGSPATIRVFVHSQGSQADVDELTRMIDRVAREHVAVYGELPRFEPGHYTFLLDYVPWGDGDGMEHRNSTSISNPGVSIDTPQGRQRALGTISHEFFHTWNVERIRPVGLEPFDFTRENITCCLWLAEGFTQYYGPLLITRAGFTDDAPVGSALAVIGGSGRQVRSAVQMSEHAPFNDAGVSVDAHDRSRTFISYYTYGAAVALALDLSLRDMSNGSVTLDDYMRRLWERFGKPGGSRPGEVATPYSLRDLRDVLADLSGNRAFADEFFDQYVEGREVADYARLLERAGYVMAPRNAAAGWVGSVQLQPATGGLVVRGLVPFATPAYGAGIDSGDVITAIDGQPATADAWSALASRAPGDRVTVTLRRRDGRSETATMTVAPDPALQIRPIEQTGGALTPAQRAFRESWLGPKAR
jgi:predicted metalloprotease with PDZ domain